MAYPLSRLPCHLSLNIRPSYKRITGAAMQVRAQRFRDEGKSGNNVDANLSVLRERIEEVRIRERLERGFRCKYGWNYEPGYNNKLKKEVGLHDHHFVDLVGLVCGTIGFTFIAGALFLSLVSLFVHLRH
ncbi:PREDICTED: uncharacterized protein LOC105123439 isoform X2 [Populus euphratica]|uniref:Uncharacterized protein LOC105123439 isoform X2 n=1 Tax=Populus euphratica TaxID=75702 RepID=A0AAJ6U2G5_POPEU|nr:PREDICTED: uncharacterized protein LOC105123439 isoform X2 [Populus euphratica]